MNFDVYLSTTLKFNCPIESHHRIFEKIKTYDTLAPDPEIVKVRRNMSASLRFIPQYVQLNWLESFHNFLEFVIDVIFSDSLG